MTGLRQRKKERRREEIAAAALELFDRQGYQATTLAQIAAAAEVSPRTVSTYFPAKEMLVFPDTDEWLARLRDRLRDRETGETAADALRAWLDREIETWDAQADEVVARRRVIDANEALISFEHGVLHQVRDEVALAIAADLDRSPDDLETRMAAAATTAIFEAVADHYKAFRPSGPGADEGELPAMMDRAVVFAAAGIRALRDG